jgi:lipoprotein-releasing system ATP-binding protein
MTMDTVSAPLVLSLHGVTRTYKSGERTLNVLRGGDLDLRAGEVVGLVGPSGSGKSTLLHIAGLLEKPDTGTVMFGGKDALAMSDKQRTLMRRMQLGFVYQFHHLLPELNAVDNVCVPLMINGVSRGKARKRGEELLAMMGLTERAHHQPGQLSGGEQQRVAIARSLANHPAVLIADEPTGNLDPATSNRVFQNLLDIARKERVAVLVATHNLELTTHMDRVLTLVEGKPEAAHVHVDSDGIHVASPVQDTASA